MNSGIGRRDLLAGAALGGLFLPGLARAAAPVAGFTHGVATGEPGQTSMLFWTRFAAGGDRPVPLRLEISADPRMARSRVVAEALAEPGRDWTARARVEGLAPGRTYFYRWLGPGKTKSPVGRTKTLPEGSPNAFRLGVFSCSNLPFGWFNAYGHAVAADDIDLMVHVGDYIYEYPRGTYPSAQQAVAGRVIEPAHEIIRREDYWARYRSYRADPDLQAIHAAFPAITLWDDHELANDAWMRGAENHDPASEGPWADRMAAAIAAYRDWMPVSDAVWARYDIGRLATLYRLDTRVSGREEPLDVARAIRSGSDAMAGLKRLRDEEWLAGGRQLLGLAQEKWLFAEMEGAARRGVRWQVLAQQVVMGELKLPPDAVRLAGPNPPAQLAAFLKGAGLASQVGLPMNLDAWDGYPAARARLLATAQRHGTDLVVLAGDSHNAWASDLLHMGRPVGVEFAGQSVSSPGFEAYLTSTPPAAVAGALTAANPTLKWADTGRRGYMQVTLTPAEAVCEWRFTGPATVRAPKLAAVVRGRALAGRRSLVMG
ncbi:alkaline phosphatase D family protein [Sandaracinobacteroides sp. A072]|uniref:alkaline phosphatase D family protein n=1 Tax=Sandaracinobacteroides sp. A072 TaxID=3461146 RepID=UPI0040417689